MHEEKLKNKGTLRNQDSETKYENHIARRHLRTGCALCKNKEIVGFKYWKIITNKFPYDAVAIVHEMLIVKRHTDGTDLTEEEITELLELRAGFLNDNYQYIIEALPNAKSVPGHLHLHLIITK
jgi:diadenosine tetraphosphate (Ap4A) HIT family hydrolase